ncbi:hypothetical protein NQ317_003947 [Molorchus minor]|uniref:Peptidase aspartic putative domain-containing protein n=1 Tax=Molorchus minor TaxID=1323400 RepID=A0ABQ9JFD7_9CUCU|nr:hypothetical protein NQ317_003947 [Molorchus minor]
MEALIKQRARVKSSITRIETFLNKNIDKQIDINEYVTRETGLVKAFEKYTLIQDEIEELEDDQEQDRIDTENKFYSLHAALKSKLQTTNNQSVVQPINSQQPPVIQPYNTAQVKLPSLSIPSFGGKLEEWKSFIDLFNALIDNNSQLTNVQKFVYLKSALSNEPLNLIDKLQLTNENYTVALNILNERYDNKLVIINNHIRNLLEVPPVNRNLREFITHTKQHLNSLESLNVSTKEWDLLLIYILSQKIDFNTRKAYELEKSSTELPTLKEFFAFLEKRCVALENLAPPDTKKRVSHIVNTRVNTNSNDNKKCMYCNLSNHSIYKCLKFKALPITQKRQFIQTNRLCFNCFGSKHTVERCTSRGCSTCQRKHHTLLHYNNGEQVNNPEGNSNDISPPNPPVENNNQASEISLLNTELATHSNSCVHGIQVLLATATVKLIAADGEPVYAKALLDNGSQTSFMSQELFKKLNHKPYIKNMQISGIGNSSTQTNYAINIKICSLTEPKHKFNVSCTILNKITCHLPQVIINKDKLDIPENIMLADPSFFKPSKIDLLLGSDIYFDIITPGLIKLGDQLPTLQNSYLGWIIAGPVSKEIISAHSINISLFSSTCDINELMPRFWQLEEVANKRFLSPQDKQCETLFINTTKRLENGSFQVDLPLLSPDAHLKLGDSYNAASKRFYSLEKRLEKNNKLHAQYKGFIDEYVALSHGKFVPLELTNNKLENKYFLPHHCVIREESATTKLRVVFDASMKTSTGCSLNDIMHKGYTVQPELVDILCRFRLFKFVLISDIQKMYRQVKVNPSQLFLQNILWRDSPNDELKCIELQTVTYGTNSAPYLATRCLVQLANEQKEIFPLAAEAILTQCYMDDILFGSSTIEELFEIREQLVNMLKSAGFTLHKWSSNSDKMLDLFDKNHAKGSEAPEFNIKMDNLSNKVLANAEILEIQLHGFADASVKCYGACKQWHIVSGSLIILRKIPKKMYGPLKVNELRNALIFIIKVTQINSFSYELSQLKGKQPISNASIASLNPFIDQDELLRVGGRLSNANIPFNQKYPILLPAKNHVVTLLLRKEHLRLYHAGAQTHDLSNIPVNRLTIWQNLSKLRQDFWKRWSREYLTRLQNRPKWMIESKNLKVNDIVLLKEDNTPPLNWPRGRILELISGSDNKVRVVKLKTAEGMLTRPIVKLCPLPLDD